MIASEKMFMNYLPTFGPHREWLELRMALAPRVPGDVLAELSGAVDYAAAQHADQRRPAGEPYIEHVLETVDVLVHGPGIVDGSVLIAGALHDVVEDTVATLADVRERFNDDVAALVGWVTKPDPESGEDPAEVRRRYLESLSRAPDRAVWVKLADRISNVQRLDTHPRSAKRSSYYRETVQYITPLAARHEWYCEWFNRWMKKYAFLVEGDG